VGGAEESGIGAGGEAVLQGLDCLVDLAGAGVKFAELLVGIGNPGTGGVSDEERFENANGLVVLAILGEDGADGEEGSGRSGVGGPGKFLELGDRLGQLAAGARAFEVGEEGVVLGVGVFGESVGLLVGDHGLVILLQ
jgi:hypothetical protein